MNYSYEDGKFIEVQGSVLVNSSLQFEGNTVFFDSSETTEAYIREAWNNKQVIEKRALTVKKLSIKS